ncbi:hypothetical protein K440DRAFT_632987 [Wilcoxina mikolae CBS 423.85]|nr:hypothetical protein K440DRAFT_632987 [Wilcoxina mikolae CBS 423.85]
MWYAVLGPMAAAVVLFWAGAAVSGIRKYTRLVILRPECSRVLDFRSLGESLKKSNSGAAGRRNQDYNEISKVCIYCIDR